LTIKILPFTGKNTKISAGDDPNLHSFGFPSGASFTGFFVNRDTNGNALDLTITGGLSDTPWIIPAGMGVNFKNVRGAKLSVSLDPANPNATGVPYSVDGKFHVPGTDAEEMYLESDSEIAFFRLTEANATTSQNVITPSGYVLKQDANGYIGVFNPSGVELGYFTADRFIFVGQGGNKNLEINLNGQTSPLFPQDAFIHVDTSGNLFIDNSVGELFLNAYTHNTLEFEGPLLLDYKISRYGGINTVGFSLLPLLGLDNRRGLTAADASPITLYTTTTAAGQLYRLTGRIFCTAGTTPSATYTLKWTEGGITVTKTLTVSAVGADAEFSALIQPDNGTAITAQLTAISGTGATVNVAASVEELN
jgi:hypothetical protein